jgi:hypothetical protein
VNDKIKLKRGTTSQWAAANPILLLGEPGIDTTENKVKYGDGVTAWSGLAFSGGGGGGGGGGANLSVTTTSTTITVASDSGTDATLATASGSVAGIMTAAQFTKLDGIATGATANSSDATLLARANHTGTQAWSTITSTPTTLAGYGISDSITAAAAAAAYQPLDSDLTAIAALTTTSFGRSLLTQADAAATRTTIGAGTSNFNGAYSSLSGIPGTFTPAAHNHAGSEITSGTVDPARLGSGTAITTKFLRGDSTWQSISGGGDALVASNLDQFADVTQTAGQTLSITSSTTLSGGTHSGTNTGDNAVNSLYSGLVSNATHTGDATGATALTLATVNSNVGSFGTATQSSQITVNAKGLVTAAANVTVTPAVGSITGLGTGVATALAVNVGSAGSTVVNGGALGTPASGVATNLTGTASGLTAGNVTTNANLTGHVTSVGNAAVLGSFTKAQLDSAVSDGNVLYVGDAPTAHVHAGADITTGTVDPARLGSGSSITTKFLRGDSTWQFISGGGDALVASNLDQFADVTQTAGQTLSITSSTTLSGGTHSGTNTGDNAVNSLYSGLVSNANHTGDVTGDTVLTIANSAVTLAKTTGIQKAITSGTAAPSGGVDGDIYLQYT